MMPINLLGSEAPSAFSDHLPQRFDLMSKGDSKLPTCAALLAGLRMRTRRVVEGATVLKLEWL